MTVEHWGSNTVFFTDYSVCIQLIQSKNHDYKFLFVFISSSWFTTKKTLWVTFARFTTPHGYSITRTWEKQQRNPSSKAIVKVSAQLKQRLEIKNFFFSITSSNAECNSAWFTLWRQVCIHLQTKGITSVWHFQDHSFLDL